MTFIIKELHTMIGRCSCYLFRQGQVLRTYHALVETIPKKLKEKNLAGRMEVPEGSTLNKQRDNSRRNKEQKRQQLKGHLNIPLY